LLKNRIIKNFS